MTRRFLSLLLSLCLAYPASAIVQPQAAELAQGIRQVEEGDLAAAVITLDSVVQRLSTVKGSEKDLATAHLYLGMAHLGLSQFERGKAEMVEAWRNNKGMKLDPKKFPPRVIQAYEEAKNEASRAQPGTTATPSPAKSPTETKTAKKGGSKMPLILGGVAALGAAVVLGGGGDNAVIARPSATPRPTPYVLQTGVAAFTAPNSVNGTNFSVPSAGAIQFIVNWTFSTSTFRLEIKNGVCPGASILAQVGPSATRPLTLNLTASGATSYCRYVYYVTGVGSESFSAQVVFTPQ